MKVRFKSAHGYFSFQPPTTPEGAVTVQYRNNAGPWEEVDIEGLTMPTPPDPGPGPTPPQTGIPAAIQPIEQSAAYVGRVKDWLLSQGHDLSGPCGAFDIVKNVVWYLYVSGSYGVGLLEKSGGNNCQGYATDIVMYSTMNGDIIDILGDGGNNNTPQWGVSDTVDPGRWRPPVNPAG